MVDILRFGAGWEGEVLECDEVEEEVQLFGRPEMHEVKNPYGDTPDDIFIDHTFHVEKVLVNGSYYMVAYCGQKPSLKMVEKAVIEYCPHPII